MEVEVSRGRAFSQMLLGVHPHKLYTRIHPLSHICYSILSRD